MFSVQVHASWGRTWRADTRPAGPALERSKSTATPSAGRPIKALSGKRDKGWLAGRQHARPLDGRWSLRTSLDRISKRLNSPRSIASVRLPSSKKRSAAISASRKSIRRRRRSHAASTSRSSALSSAAPAADASADAVAGPGAAVARSTASCSFAGSWCSGRAVRPDGRAQKKKRQRVRGGRAGEQASGRAGEQASGRAGERARRMGGKGNAAG